ncbi:MAG: hypothetical protein EXS36_19730 [Pedosphaera sp.]|nr:hypothetical protein [Pedosphaera sp.]
MGDSENNQTVDTEAAYKGPSEQYGKPNDLLVGKKCGGGLALYDKIGKLLGAIGVSGDTSCTDHIVAWKVRHALNLDNVPAGVSTTGDDNIVHDIFINGTGHPESPSGWGHPDCGAADLPVSFPVGPNP